MNKLSHILTVLWLEVFCVFGAIITPDENYKLDIIHYNDFHSRFEETSLASSICQTNDTSCLGGFPRLYHHINKLLLEKPDAVLLNAGDSFQGTYWYTLLKWNIVQEFMNMLPHDAHAIGNHEFDDGPAGLVPYLKALKAPVLAANMDTTNEPSFERTYKPSIVIERKGKKIGIIGLVTVDSKVLSHTGNIVFTDPGEATRREALALTKQGVDIIILLSHCGLDVDKQLAREHGQYIDIIVGGHTHSLLWNGPSPSGDEVKGPYPVFIESTADEKHKVLIVQASSFTKYMGNLTVYFDRNGDYLKWDGGPLFLNRSIEEDEEIKKKLAPYAKLVHEAANTPVGESLVTLRASDCGNGECGLGDLMADAMVERAKLKLNSSVSYIGFFGINSQSPVKLEKGTITKGQMFEINPYHGDVEYFQMEGRHLKEVFERSVTDVTDYYPRLLQVSDYRSGTFLLQRLAIAVQRGNAASVMGSFASGTLRGVQVTFNMSQPEGSRVISILIGDSKTELEPNVMYNVVAPTFWTFNAEFSRFIRYMRNEEIIGYDNDIAESYIKKHSPINIVPSGRLILNK